MKSEAFTSEDSGLPEEFLSLLKPRVRTASSQAIEGIPRNKRLDNEKFGKRKDLALKLLEDY